MKKRNVTALSEILANDINVGANLTEDFQMFLFNRILGMSSGIVFGLSTTQNGSSGITVASGALVDSTYAYGELEGASGVSLTSLPSGGTRTDTVSARYLEIADNPGASYVLIDVESRTQTTSTVYRRKFGSVVVEIHQDTASGALTGNRIPIASLTVTSGGIQSVTDLRTFVKPTNVDVNSISGSINSLIASASVGGDLSGTVSNATVAKIKNIPVSGAPTASGQVLRINSAQTHWEYVDGSSLGGNAGSGESFVLQWTNSGATIGTTGSYLVPAVASGAVTLIPGDGQTFYEKGTYSFDGANSVVTFSVLPPSGASLEFFYSAQTLTSGIITDYVTEAEFASIPTGNITNFNSAVDARITNAGLVAQKYAYIVDQKTSGNNGDGLTDSTWTKLTLNTEVSDPDGLVTISSSEFTLISGTYIIEWTAPVRQTSAAPYKSRLYNVTDSSVEQYGSSTICGGGGTSGLHQSTGWARISLASAKTYKLEGYIVGVGGTQGYATSIASIPEIYNQVKITKIA